MQVLHLHNLLEVGELTHIVHGCHFQMLCVPPLQGETRLYNMTGLDRQPHTHKHAPPPPHTHITAPDFFVCMTAPPSS